MLTYNWHIISPIHFTEETISWLKKSWVEWKEPIMVLIWEVKKRVSIFITLNEICLDNEHNK